MFSWFAKAGAQNGLDWSQIGLLIFTGVIVIGLFGEYRKARDDRWTGLGDAFEVLVIVGVVGELFFDALIFGFSERLEVLQENALTTATIEARDAHIEARKANGEATFAYLRGENALISAQFANTAAANAIRDAENAAKGAQDAAAKAATALDENTKLRLRVASQQGAVDLLTNQNDVLQSANLKLQNELLTLQKEQRQSASAVGSIAKQTQDRSISEDQRDAVLRDVNGHRRLLYVVLLDDREPRAFGIGIAGILSEAHYVVRRIDFGHTSPLTGVIVCDSGFQAIKLYQALSNDGIATSFRHSRADTDANRPPECPGPSIFSDIPPNAYRIFVGQRE